ncbi:MAG: hypothetical protein WKG00_21665 [Polyangiaceae bacterium]
MFREPPRVELGPLDIGLVGCVRRAVARLPRGGRVRGRRPVTWAPCTVGAIGSGGLCASAAAAFVTSTSGWQPEAGTARALVMALVLCAGLSLALLLRALDDLRREQLGDAMRRQQHGDDPREDLGDKLQRELPGGLPGDRSGSRGTATRVLRGEVVGRAARRILGRIARLANLAEKSPHQFGPRRVTALRRAIAAVRDPDVSPWIPSDLLGRAELLLARAVALQAGQRWVRDPEQRADVGDLLRRAARHLDDPRSADADLDAMGEKREHRTRRRAGGAYAPSA